MRTGVLLANILGWPVIQLGTSALLLRLPNRWFAPHPARGAPREREARLYRRWLAVRRWKSLLPDGAPWLGGFPKSRLQRRDPAYLNRFLLETRRSECAHWCALAALPLFFLWNPLSASGIMTAYALAANLPCIVAQRYNRIALARLLTRTTAHPAQHRGAEAEVSS